MIYEWDPEKATANLKKHRVAFDEAISVFTDPLALTFDDPDHSGDERRFITIGATSRERVVRTPTGAQIAFDSSVPDAPRNLRPMPIKNPASSADELRREYDLTSLKGGLRGKYYARATAGTTLVLLEPDVAAAFPTGKAVNQALRALHSKGRKQLPNKRLQPTRSRTPSKARPRG